MRRFVFIRTPVLAVDTGRTQNVGYEQRQVMAALARLSHEGHTVEILDGGALDDEQRAKLISDTRMAFTAGNQRKGRKVGNSFGTNSQPWQDYGTGIPVLLVYENERCVDAYPHVESDRPVTIADYLRVTPTDS
jgi:hypothetical protein